MKNWWIINTCICKITNKVQVTATYEETNTDYHLGTKMLTLSSDLSHAAFGPLIGLFIRHRSQRGHNAQLITSLALAAG